ncbi:hypothetical protein L7F22_056200 [Adiantum nelumboides]|nr:hypothetical protein [Adiantum nelumboides]
MPFNFRLQLWLLIMSGLATIMLWQKVCAEGVVARLFARKFPSNRPKFLVKMRQLEPNVMQEHDEMDVFRFEMKDFKEQLIAFDKMILDHYVNKDQVWDVLVQKKQIPPLKSQGVKPKNIEIDAWKELDEMCRSTIILFFSKSVYYNVKDAEGGAYELWQRICDMYDKHSAASMVYWIKKLIDLQMEEGDSTNAYLNEFNTIFSQPATQKITFEDNVKSMFLLVTLPESWDTFKTAISNLVPTDELTSINVESSLLMEEINWKNNASSKPSSAMVVRDRTMKKHKFNRGQQ